jgi:hypothetical protein
MLRVKVGVIQRALWLCLLASAGLTEAARADSPLRPVPPPVLPPLAQRAQAGLFAPGTPYYPRNYWALEKKLGTRAEIVSGFVDFDYVFGEPRDLALSLKGKRKLLYSWEPHCAKNEQGVEECVSFRSLIEGKHDEYLERIALSMQSFPGEIYVRPWAEMNAPWSPYRADSGSPRAGTREEFKEAWRHLVKYFRTRGINNLRFVFSPDASEDADTVPVSSVWPGMEYVDVLGIDGYNWGNGGPAGKSSWREFEAIFAPMYQRLSALHPNAPVWICEFGSKEPRRDDGTPESPAPVDPGHDKAKWLEQALSSREFSHLAALVFYSSRPAHGSYQRDFQVDSSPGSLRATRAYLRLRQRIARPKARLGKKPARSRK